VPEVPAVADVPLVPLVAEVPEVPDVALVPEVPDVDPTDTPTCTVLNTTEGAAGFE